MVELLSHASRTDLAGLLEQDPVANLFLLGRMRCQDMTRAPWFGIRRGGALVAAALVVPERLAVPWAPVADDAGEIGLHLRGLAHVAGMVIGPRDACDALWAGWAPGTPRLWYDQRLYVQDTPPAGERVDGFRVAKMRDLTSLIHASARMEEEDLGRNPLDVDPVGHEAATRERIRSGRTWVIERDGQLVFHIHAGTWIADGCQVGGTYVSPAHRGRGIGAAGMRELGRVLLARTADGRHPDDPEHPAPARITLHVNEANTPAIRTYETAGYRRAHAFRLAAAHLESY